MRIGMKLGAVLALGWSLPLGAVQVPLYDVPYAGGGISTLKPDSARNADAVGGGYSLYGGWALSSGHEAVELRLIDQGMRRKADGESNYQSSLFVDYVYDFGTTSREGGFLSGTKFFGLAGIGAVREDSYGNPGTYAGVALGGGALLPLGFYGLALRLDGRAQAEQNEDLCTAQNVAAGFCTSEKSLLIDYMFQASVQVPLTFFFKTPAAVAPAEDCPIAVVDPATGRKDCGSDADHDGVADAADQCPRTESGTAVDAQGCSNP